MSPEVVPSGGFAHPRIRWRLGLSAAGLALLLAAACTGGAASTRTAASDELALVSTAPQDEDPHAGLGYESRFPSAGECRTCHEDHYRQWSVSGHAYAQLSPVFNAMQAKADRLLNGTLGDFCIRCHTPVGMTLEEPTFAANADRSPIAREGITCISCHRVDQAYGRVSGRRALRQGELTDTILGPSGNAGLAEAIASEDFFLNPGQEGQRGHPVHARAEKFFQLVQPGFCATCHDVNLPNGFRLEEAFSEYESSPAAARGETCQDCHMGTEPGVASGYATGPAAFVDGVPTPDRRITDHRFVGPDISLVHPGIFPHNTDAQAVAGFSQWLAFDHDAGWGTDAFEEDIPQGTIFPHPWEDSELRIEAREILEEQFELLDEAHEARLKLLRRGYLLGSVRSAEADQQGALAFDIRVSNGTDGHSVPTGFTAERLVWLEVTVKDRAGEVVLRSGDLDPNGDLRDEHSRYVHNGELPADEQLFSLQSKFLVRGLHGGERERILAVDLTTDPLPFLRPEPRASSIFGRPAGARIHKQGLPPGGHRDARYQVSAEALRGRTAPFSATVRLKAAMVPVNLIAEIADVGFDYGLSARELARRLVATHIVLHETEASLATP